MAGAAAQKKAPAGKAQKKSGIVRIEAGETIFKENDVAQSLYIIQKGQVRLYRPKGQGFVELAILRSGEVIGEMAYFDENSRRRSCSASAILDTEVVEISFNAFEKTIENLNPWFKTIINTLADRLRKTNERVKSLESNSVGFGGGKASSYVFFHNADIIKILTVLNFVFTSEGKKIDGNQLEVHLNKLKFYMGDIFNVQEIKMEEFFEVLKSRKFITVAKDEDGLPKLIRCSDPEEFKRMMMFINSERRTDDEKQIKISAKCEIFLGYILQEIEASGAKDDQVPVNISKVLNTLEENNVPVIDEDLTDAVDAKLCSDIVVGEKNQLSSIVNYKKIKQIFPALKLMNAVRAVNDSKQDKKY